MQEELDTAIKALAASATKPEADSNDALKLTQAALNLSHTKSILQEVTRNESNKP